MKKNEYKIYERYWSKLSDTKNSLIKYGNELAHSEYKACR